MASFVQSFLRLVGSKPPQAKARSDEEHATAAGSVVASSTLGGYSFPPPSQTIQPTGQRVAGDDPLTLFRLMLGITHAPHLGFSGTAARPAENLGLYARVVSSEQRSEDHYKVFSAIINACYFLQIIVAAALTALGAANADNKAVTAFGAINTIIAGFLTYLKGSGYPARLQYFASEWKKVREFIEQRERDFSLEGCTLDVYEVVGAVRHMYDTTKREIEVNTPDGYNSKTPSMAQHVSLNTGVHPSKADAIADKLRGLDETVRKLRGHVGVGGAGAVAAATGVQAKVEEDVVGRLRSLEDTLHKVKARVENAVHDGQEAVKARIEKTVHDGQEVAHDAAHDAKQSVHDEKERAAAELRGVGKAVVRGLEEHRPRPPREVSVTLSHRSGDEG